MSRQGNVYIISDGFNAYKIGVTRGPVKKRLKQLQTGATSRLQIVYWWESNDMFADEKWLHTKYAHRRVRTENEWFYLNDAELAEIVHKDFPGGYFAEDVRPGWRVWLNIIRDLLSIVGGRLWKKK